MRFSVGDVLSRSLEVFSRNLGGFLLLTVIVWSPVILYAAHLAFTLGDQLTQEHTERFDQVQSFAQLLCSNLLTGAFIFAVVQQLRGQRVSLTECVSVGLSRLFPVIWVGILAILWIVAPVFALLAVFFALSASSPDLAGMVLALGGVAAGPMALRIACSLWVAVPVAVVEQPGAIASLQRSRELTDGVKWSIFGIQLSLILIGFVAGLAIALVLPISGPRLLVELLANLVFGALYAVATAVGYHDLRVLRDGIDTNDLARIFE